MLIKIYKYILHFTFLCAAASYIQNKRYKKRYASNPMHVLHKISIKWNKVSTTAMSLATAAAAVGSLERATFLNHFAGSRN